MNKLIKFLTAIKEAEEEIRITVIGDAMVDEFFSVKTTKISPEFPVPVLTHPDGIPYLRLPGGAGNVARQFENFPFKVELVAFLDKDAKQVYKQCKINTDACLEIDNKIPRKQRFYQGDFPVARIDIEQKDYGYADIHNKVNQLIENCQSIRSKIVIFSDYNKGVIRDIWYMKDKITIVDPKKGPLHKWSGCKVIKPNAAEAKELTGRSDWRTQCSIISEATNCDAVIITDSGEGVSGWAKNEGYFHYIPPQTVKAVSVIGAGDCYISFLAMAISLGFSYADSAEIAFDAAAGYVQNKYNKPLTIEELIRQVDPYTAKFTLPSKNRDYKLVMTNGVFDMGLTASHVGYLREAKKYGDKLIVALNSDESVKRLKGDARPIMPLAERMAIVASLECVDFVTSFEEDTPLNLIKKIMPSCVVKGGDYKPEDIAGYGIVDVFVTEKLKGLSTTDKIDLL